MITMQKATKMAPRRIRLVRSRRTNLGRPDRGNAAAETVIRARSLQSP
jgi:hypothetical protein